MSAAAPVSTRTANRTAQFYRNTIGKKVVMAVTGLILFGYVVGHLAGNLQVYAGREVMNAYGEFLHTSPGLLWGTRLLLLVSVILHIAASVSLTLQARRARPERYVKLRPVQASYSSRTMMWSGPIIAAFVIYHLLHFTFGTVHPDFQQQMIANQAIPLPYDNVVSGFKVLPVSLAYIFAMVLLGMHLHHGLYSMFQSTGLVHPRYTPTLKQFARAAAALIVFGYISIPIAVLTGIVK